MELGPGRRLVTGLFLLLLVDLIWVGSSELSEFIFKDAGYNKPFFSTYMKTSMFSLYLFGFIFLKNWRQQCLPKRDSFLYQIEVPAEDPLIPEPSSLSEPSYEPLKIGGSEKSSDVESDDSSIRSVRFSKMTEVRQLSETDGVDAMYSRLSYTASQRAEQYANEAVNKFSIKVVMMLSLIFCLWWFLGNYAYQLGLSDTEAAVVNVVSSTSGVFTLILAAIFPSSPSDKFSLSRLICVLFMVIGTVLISLEDIKLENSSLPLGVFWALIGSIVYAVYIVFLKYKVPSEENMDLTMFFGFVGLFNAVILWPGFILLDLVGWETFELPNRRQFLYMALNGLIGTVLSELLWLWGCFLTSSLMGTLSLSLTIPITMAFDIVIKGVRYSWLFYIGSLPVILSFVFITILTHYDDRDPVLECCKFVSRFCSSRKKDYRLISLDVNEQESLIVNIDDETNCDDIYVGEEINVTTHNFSNS